MNVKKKEEGWDYIGGKCQLTFKDGFVICLCLYLLHHHLENRGHTIHAFDQASSHD